MNGRGYILLACTVAIVAMVSPVRADAEPTMEYKVKAAFLFNFIKFVTWPEHRENEETIVIGILGRNDFGNAFNEIQTKAVKGKKLVVKHFGLYAQIEDQNKPELSECHMLFISVSEDAHMPAIIKALEGKAVLVVGETAKFPEGGAMINFVMADKKVAFEINEVAAGKAGLQIAAQLMRLARRVIRSG